MAIDIDHHITGPGAVTLELAGRLDITTVATLRAALRGVLRNSVTELTVDLRSVVQLDVAAVTAIASGAATVQSGGARFVLVEPASPAARRSLDYCGLPALLSA